MSPAYAAVLVLPSTFPDAGGFQYKEHRTEEHCLDAKLKFQNYYIEWESYIHKVLNLDEIKN